MMRSKVFELLDFPWLARPSINLIRVDATSDAVRARLAEESFMSYNSVWPKLIDVVRSGVTEQYLVDNFSFYNYEWKNKALQSAVRELNALMGGRGVWYRMHRGERAVTGFVFKSSIRGVWFYENKAYAVLINPRKSQRLSVEDVRFLARGVYELYCIDDPNDPVPMIIDLSARVGSKNRSPVSYVVPVEEAISLEAFEETTRIFLEALTAAGVATPAPADRHVVDLLRGRRY